MASSENKCYDDSLKYLSKQSEISYERLNYEDERIKSFTLWPVNYPVDPSRLAKAGFYYTGTEDEVVCFSCKGHIKNWNFGDIVLKKHSDLYPNCDFVKNMSNNVPLLKTSVGSNPEPHPVQSNLLQLESDVVCIDYNRLQSARERLKTFENWPLSNVNTTDLAHAGYFYTGYKNQVRCAFCRITVDNLDVSRVLLGKYLKHFSWCGFMAEKSSSSVTTKLWYQSSPQDICGNMKLIDTSSTALPSSNQIIKTFQQKSELEDLGVHLHKDPVCPSYASFSVRLKSFDSWPSSTSVPIEDLAAAGFFYEGVGDRTLCFHCYGGLKYWEEGDDPWVEHARWFSGCDFLRLNKGSDFIIACLLTNVSKLLKENSEEPSCGLVPAEFLLKNLDEAMNCNLVRRLLDSNVFPPYIIRAALLLEIKKNGCSFSSEDDLCVAASCLKDKMESEYLKEKFKKQSINEKYAKAEDLNIHLRNSENCTISNEPDEEKMCLSASSCSDLFDKDNSEKDKSKVISGTVLSEKSNVQELEKEDFYLCKICMDKELGVVFLPCGHLAACTLCAPALKHCPMCRKSIQATVRCYLH